MNFDRIQKDCNLNHTIVMTVFQVTVAASHSCWAENTKEVWKKYHLGNIRDVTVTQAAVTMCHSCCNENQQEFWKYYRFEFYHYLHPMIVALVAVAVFLLLTRKPTRSLEKQQIWYYYLHHVAVVKVTLVAVAVFLMLSGISTRSLEKQ